MLLANQNQYQLNDARSQATASAALVIVLRAQCQPEKRLTGNSPVLSRQVGAHVALDVNQTALDRGQTASGAASIRVKEFPHAVKGVASGPPPSLASRRY